MSSVISGAGPAHAVQFGTYEAVKEWTGVNDDSSSNQWVSTGACFLDMFYPAQC